MPEEAKFELVELSPEEATVVKNALEAFMAEHSVHFVVSPIIKPNGTLSAIMNVLKKQEASVPSPAEFLPNNGENPESAAGSESSANA